MLKKLLSLLVISMLLIIGVSTMAEEAPSSESKAVIEGGSEEEGEDSKTESAEDEEEISLDPTLAPEEPDAQKENSSDGGRRASVGPSEEPDEGVLRSGSRGERVRQMQEKLNELGYNAGYADGQFGPRTESAVLAYQKDRGLVESGTISEIQFDALMDLTILEPTKESTVESETVFESAYEQSINNLLRNTGRPQLGKSNYEEGVWRSASGGDGVREIIEIDDAPVEGILQGIHLVNTEKTEKYTSVGINDVPVEYGKTYILSCYAKGTGTLRLMYGNSPYVSISVDLDAIDVWRRYALLLIPDEGTNFSESDTSTQVFFGVPSKKASDVIICGMQLIEVELPDWTN